MRRALLLDYILFLITGCALLNLYEFNTYSVFYPLVSISLLLFTIAPINWANKYGSLIVLCLLGYYNPTFIFMIPATFRVTGPNMQPKEQWGIVVGASLLIVVLSINARLLPTLLLLTLLLLSQRLVQHQLREGVLINRYLSLKDNAWEQHEQLSLQHQTLLTKQNEILQLQMTNERNRIARDIHDHVGHLLSSSIIQLGALSAINHDHTLDPAITDLSDTIHLAMDNVRRSVHDMHHVSYSFEEGVRALTEPLPKNILQLNGPIWQSLETEQSEVLLLIIKEAITNIQKHSRATLVSFSFDDYPGFYRLTIENNHCLSEDMTNSGLGLTSMQERIRPFKGRVLPQLKNKTFTLTIILPKENKHD